MAAQGADPGTTCGQCGYDLRGTTSQACPECGSSLRRRTAQNGLLSARDRAFAEAAHLTELRAATIGTVCVWGGITCLPVVGSVAWVLQAIMGLWRGIAVFRLSRSGILTGDLASKSFGILRVSVWAEVLVGVLGGFLTFTVSMGGASIFSVFALLVLRVVWICVLGLNTYLIARVGMHLGRVHRGKRLPEWIPLGVLATLVAPGLMVVGIAAGALAATAAGGAEEWILESVQFLSAVGCLVGMAGIVATCIVLSRAARAAIAERLEEPSTPITRHKPHRISPQPDPTPICPGEDVIPFADEDDDQRR